MFDVLTILHDHSMLLLMGQYPNGPLGGVLCTLLISLLAVVLSAWRVGRARASVAVARITLGRHRVGLHAAWYSVNDGGVLDVLLRASADWAEYQWFFHHALHAGYL